MTSSALITVDLDSIGRMETHSTELLVESSSTDFRSPELDRIYQRHPVSFSREIVDTVDDAGVIDDLTELEDWDVLAKNLIITSSKPFEWLNDFDSKTESEGILSAASGLKSNRPAVQVYQASLYWECRTGPGWMEGLRSLFYMFVSESCSRFYLFYGRSIMLFTRQPKACCLISNYSSTLGETLRSQGVSIPVQSQEELKVLGSKAASCVKISGHPLRALYNYLANSDSEMRVVAPVPFINSTLRSLKTTFNGESAPPPEQLSQTSAFRQPQQAFRWVLEGPITSTAVRLLCNSLEAYHDEFEVEIVSEGASKALSDSLVSKVSWRSHRYQVTYCR
jgi:hypothetical protein